MPFLLLSYLVAMSVFGIIRAVVLGVFSIFKFAILSVLRLGRWCWDRIHLK